MARQCPRLSWDKQEPLGNNYVRTQCHTGTSIIASCLMWILGRVALLDGLRSSTGIFPRALSLTWACAQTTGVDLSPRPSPTLGPGASLPLN